MSSPHHTTHPIASVRVAIRSENETLAEILGNWVRGKTIPVELAILPSDKEGEPDELELDAFGNPAQDVGSLARRWLEGECKYTEDKDSLLIADGPHKGTAIRILGRKVKVEAKVDLDPALVQSFRHAESEDLDSFTSDLRMVLSLKPCEFMLALEDGIPTGFAVTTEIYADGLTKDRLISALPEISRARSLGLMMLSRGLPNGSPRSVRMARLHGLGGSGPDRG